MLIAMINLAAGVGLLAALLFLTWVAWAYYRYGKLKNISGVVTLAAIIATLPLGVRLVMERTQIITQASTPAQVTAIQVEMLSQDKAVVYVTLSDAAFSYLEFDNSAGNKQVILSQGKIEPRIGHSFVIDNVSKMASKTGKIYVDGKADARLLTLR